MKPLDRGPDHSPGSSLKIDPAASAVLSCEAHTDAIAAGASAPPKRSRYEDPGAGLDFV